jgi:hypothetical protein
LFEPPLPRTKFLGPPLGLTVVEVMQIKFYKSRMDVTKITKITKLGKEA